MLLTSDLCFLEFTVICQFVVFVKLFALEDLRKF